MATEIIARLKRKNCILAVAVVILLVLLILKYASAYCRKGKYE